MQVFVITQRHRRQGPGRGAHGVPRTANMRYPMGAPGRVCRRGPLSPQPTLWTCDGRLAQRESASFTPRRSLVRSQYRPLSSPAGSDCGTGLFSSLRQRQRQQRFIRSPAGGPGTGGPRRGLQLPRRRRRRGAVPDLFAELALLSPAGDGVPLRGRGLSPRCIGQRRLLLSFH